MINHRTIVCIQNFQVSNEDAFCALTRGNYCRQVFSDNFEYFVLFHDCDSFLSSPCIRVDRSPLSA